MPSREPELYKDKIEVSLDGRQIFYLFFGGAVIVGLVFVVGVMVGRRVESRGHLDRADTQTASDPLAALDRLERADNLSFHGALTGAESASDVEKAIGELEKRRKAEKAEKAEKKEAAATTTEARLANLETKPDAKLEAKPDAKLETKPDAKPEAKPDAKLDARPDHAEVRAEKPDADKPRTDKHDGEHKAKKHDDGGSGDTRPEHADAKRADARGDKPVTKPDGKPGSKTDERREPRAEGKADADSRTEGKPSKPDARPGTDAKPEGKVRFTLQLSSFQDKAEAEAFLSAMKSAGFQPYLTEADVGGKGTFYRVRLGSFRSLEAASDAKAEYEKTSKKTAQVMRL